MRATPWTAASAEAIDEARRPAPRFVLPLLLLLVAAFVAVAAARFAFLLALLLLRFLLCFALRALGFALLLLGFALLPLRLLLRFALRAGLLVVPKSSSLRDATTDTAIACWFALGRESQRSACRILRAFWPKSLKTRLQSLLMTFLRWNKSSIR